MEFLFKLALLFLVLSDKLISSSEEEDEDFDMLLFFYSSFFPKQCIFTIIISSLIYFSI